MQIKIYDQHKKWQSADSQYCMILGVNSYKSFLSQFKYKNNIKILMKGNIRSVVQNILWNQFYSYTLLKDIQRTIFQQAQTKNSFIKINNKTFRLNDCLQWVHSQKIGDEIIKYPSFNLQCFMNDSSIKFVSIFIDSIKNEGCDIIFEYLTSPEKSLKQSSNYESINISKKQRVQSVPRTIKQKENINHKSTIQVKSLFEYPQKFKKSQYSTKYLTQKKNFETKPKHPIIIQKEKKKSKSRKPDLHYESLQKQSQKLSFKQTQKNLSNQARMSYSIGISNHIPREDLTAAILHSKQQKIKQYQIMHEKKEKEFQKIIEKIQKSHEQEVAAIKKQVKSVLDNYKKKNKQLKKQNQCLLEMNHKLCTANKDISSKFQQLSQAMRELQQRQQIIEKHNIQYSLKIQTLENENKKLVQKFNQQQNYFRSEITQKDKQNIEIKSKYERLLNSIKLMSVQNKQNMVI